MICLVRMVPLVDGIDLHNYTITMQSNLFPEPYWIHVQVSLQDRKKKYLTETNASMRLHIVGTRLNTATVVDNIKHALYHYHAKLLVSSIARAILDSSSFAWPLEENLYGDQCCNTATNCQHALKYDYGKE